MNTPNRNVHPFLAVTATIALGLIAAHASAAATPHAWTGSVSSNWTTAGNWDPSTTYPGGGSTRSVVFDRTFDSTHQPTMEANVGSPIIVGGVWVTGTTVGDIEIGVSGGTRTFETRANLFDGSDAGVMIDANTSGKLAINTTSFKVGAAQSWVNNSSKDFTINASVNLNSLALTVRGSGHTVINGQTIGSGSASSLTKDGTGVLTLAPTAGGHTYSGPTTVKGGALVLSGTLQNTGSTAAAVNVENGTLRLEGLGSISDNLNAGSGLTVSGNTSAGTAGIFTGNGTIGRISSINAGGTIAPGADASTKGVLTFGRNLTLAGVAHFDLQSPGVNDQINFTGASGSSRTLTFGGVLKVDGAPGMAWQHDQVFDLFTWGNNTLFGGTKFSSIELPTLPSGLSWKMFGDQPFDYSTGEIVVVPEPASFAAIGLAGGALLLRRRKTR